MDLFFQLFVHLFRRFPTYNWWLLWQNSLFWTVFELEEIICLKFINIHLATHCQPGLGEETIDCAVSQQSGSLHKMLMFAYFKQNCIKTIDKHVQFFKPYTIQMNWELLRIYSQEFSQAHLEPFQINPCDVIKLNSISVPSSPLIPPTGKLNIFQCYRAQWGFFCSFIALSLVQTVAIFRGYIFFVSLC